MNELPETLGVPWNIDRAELAFCAGHLYRARWQDDRTQTVAGLKSVILLARHRMAACDPEDRPSQLTLERARKLCANCLSPRREGELPEAEFAQAWRECCQLIATGYAADIEGWTAIDDQAA